MTIARRDFFDQPLYNAGTETIPPFAVCELKSPGLISFAGKEWFTVGKPTGSGKIFFINGPFPIPGTGTNRTGGGAAPHKAPGAHALVNSSLTLATNGALGPTGGQWYLGEGAGFTIVGDALGSGSTKRVRVTAGTETVTVYEFRNCDNTDRRLYLDNPAIAEVAPGAVAVIEADGVYECWQYYGLAPQCQTGQCARIVAWGVDCNACSVCFYLTPCGGGSPTFVSGVAWYEYVGRIVRLDGPGHEGCYSVAVADGCFDVDDALGVEHVEEVFANCDQCGCYELENCADSGDVIYVGNDLATFLNEESGADTIGRFIKFKGVCYEITGFANPCGTTPIFWETDLVFCAFGDFAGDCPEVIDSCSGCCYLLTPCPDQAGDPDPAYYRLNTDDPDLTAFVDEETGESNGRVIRLAGICYTVSVPETCPEEDVILGLPTVEEEYDECDDCITSCWERCDAAGTYLKTYADMSEVGPNAAVKRAEDGFCYKRATLSECDGDPIVDFTIEQVYDEGVDSCDICEDPRVKLVADCGGNCPTCDGPETGGTAGTHDDIVTTKAELLSAVGQWVKVEGVCRKVEWTTDAETDADPCFTGPYTSCEACAAAPTKKRVVEDVYFDDAGNLVVKYVDLYGQFNVCGGDETEIADSEECE